MSKKDLVRVTKYLNDKNINRGSSGNLFYQSARLGSGEIFGLILSSLGETVDGTA